MAVTELETARGELEDDWVINVSFTDASTAQVLRAAVADKRHGIREIIITGLTSGTEWVKILDDGNVLIGPVAIASGIPWPFDFENPIYGTLNTALKIQTQTAFKIHCIIKGVSDDMPISSPSASPSASPSPSM